MRPDFVIDDGQIAAHFIAALGIRQFVGKQRQAALHGLEGNY